MNHSQRNGSRAESPLKIAPIIIEDLYAKKKRFRISKNSVRNSFKTPELSIEDLNLARLRLAEIMRNKED